MKPWIKYYLEKFIPFAQYKNNRVLSLTEMTEMTNNSFENQLTVSKFLKTKILKLIFFGWYPKLTCALILVAKFQVHREIQQRSPNSGSRRPSLSSMISSTLNTNNLITSQLQSRLSELSLSTQLKSGNIMGEIKENWLKCRNICHSWQYLIAS